MTETIVRGRSGALLLAALLSISCGDDAASAGDGGPGDGTGTDGGPGVADASAPELRCGDGSPLALSSCVDEERYAEDLAFAALERTPESSHWMAVQDRCATTFTELGFDVERHDYGTGVNVIGVREGDDEPDRRVLVGAHYDHIPGCEGADDNASGVAGVLEAARVLSRRSFPRTLVVACWDEEERGLIGSDAYAEREVAAGRDFDVYFNFEMIGFVDETPGSQELPAGFDLLFRDAAQRVEDNDYRGDFIALIGDEASAPFLEALGHSAAQRGLRNEPLEVPAAIVGEPAAADLRRSDHDPFWQRGIPAILITDTAEFRNAAYHCSEGTDTVDRLDTAFGSEVVSATVAATAEALGLDR